MAEPHGQRQVDIEDDVEILRHGSGPRLWLGGAHGPPLRPARERPTQCRAPESLTLQYLAGSVQS